ncbi:MAG: hypothetical protein GC182_14730 [Rhodopseudomonas sp.]|nr:hypothetical protein [Rhodopseudomonas sp.]
MAVAALLLFGVGAQAGDDRRDDVAGETLSRSGPANQPLVVREHAGWDSDCGAIAPPALTLDAPPRHGYVCARSEDITIKALYLGTEAQCIGRRVRGLRLIYRPDLGFSGDDRWRYAALYPSLRRSVAVDVTVTGVARAPSVAGSVTASVTAPSHQPAGPVPACADLMF